MKRTIVKLETGKISAPKKSPAVKGEVNESTAKSRRRQALLNPVAIRLTNDPTATWSDVATAFTQALLVEKWNDDLTEGGIIEIIDGVLRSFMDNNLGIKDRVIKSPADVKAALKLSRGKRGKKK